MDCGMYIITRKSNGYPFALRKSDFTCRNFKIISRRYNICKRMGGQGVSFSDFSTENMKQGKTDQEDAEFVMP